MPSLVLRMIVMSLIVMPNTNEPTNTPVPKSEITPFLTVTPDESEPNPPGLLTPLPMPFPLIVWPPRSRVMLEAPITRPSEPGQARSPVSVVSLVITSPQATFPCGSPLA